MGDDLIVSIKKYMFIFFIISSESHEYKQARIHWLQFSCRNNFSVETLLLPIPVTDFSGISQQSKANSWTTRRHASSIPTEPDPLIIYSQRQSIHPLSPHFRLWISKHDTLCRRPSRSDCLARLANRPLILSARVRLNYNTGPSR